MNVLLSVNEKIQEKGLSMRCLLAVNVLLLYSRAYLKKCMMTISLACIITGGIFTSSLFKMNDFQGKNVTLVTGVVSGNF